MTDRPDQPESPTENLEQVAEPTAVQPVAPAGDTIPTTTPEVLADATGADSGHAPEWPEAPGTGATAAFATGGATPQTPFGPPAPAPAPTPAPDPVGRPQGQPWTASSWGGPGPSGEPWGQPPGQSWGQPPGQSWGQPPGQSWGQPPRGQQQPWGAPPGWDPYGPPAAHRGVPVPTGPAEAVKSARTLLLVAVGLVVLALFASFIGAVTARWGVIPTGVSVFAGMLNLAALVCGALALWRITGALETLTRKVTGLERD